MGTSRHRDTMAQERVNIADIEKIIENKVSMKNLLKQL